MGELINGARRFLGIKVTMGDTIMVQKLNKLNKLLESIMPLITPTSVILGVLLASYLKDYTYIIPWVFAFMTFTGSLNSNFNSFKQIFYHPMPLFVVFMILHILMPMIAWGTGQLTFGNDVHTIMGLVLAMAIPTGISSFLWVTMNSGNIPITLAIILIDTFLSPFIVPYTLSRLFQTSVTIDVVPMMTGLMWMIVLPSCLGMFLNQVTKGKSKEVLSAPLAPFSKLGVGVVVMLNGAIVAPFLKVVNLKLIGIGLTIFCLAFLGYLISFLVANLIKFDRETTVALTFTGGMRNISVGAVLAVTYFPAAVAVPVVLAMLFQQVLASFYGNAVKRYFNKNIIGHEQTSSKI